MAENQATTANTQDPAVAQNLVQPVETSVAQPEAQTPDMDFTFEPIPDELAVAANQPVATEVNQDSAVGEPKPIEAGSLVENIQQQAMVETQPTEDSISPVAEEISQPEASSAEEEIITQPVAENYPAVEAESDMVSQPVEITTPPVEEISQSEVTPAEEVATEDSQDSVVEESKPVEAGSLVESIQQQAIAESQPTEDSIPPVAEETSQSEVAPTEEVAAQLTTEDPQVAEVEISQPETQPEVAAFESSPEEVSQVAEIPAEENLQPENSQVAEVSSEQPVEIQPTQVTEDSPVIPNPEEVVAAQQVAEAQAAAAIPEAPIVNEAPQPTTTGEQFLQQNNKVTGNFIRNFFDRKNPEEVISPTITSVASPVAASGIPAAVEASANTISLREAEKVYQQGLASVRDLIAPSSLEVHYDHLQLSGVFSRSFFVYAYPRYLETNWLTPVVNFDATVDMAQFIYPISSAEIMHTLKKKVAQIQSSITMQREKGNVRDPVLETALEDAEQLRTDLQRGQEKFFQFGFYFTVYAEDEKKLEASTKLLENLLGGKLVLTKRADIQNEHAFNSTIPIALDELGVFRNMNTSPLSTTFPFVSSSLATDDGILYGLNRHNNSLIIFDRFQLPNANSTVFATSGAGKSYAVKLEILRQSMFGTDVIVIDPENEYEELAQTVGGTYLRISLNSQQRINPFDLPAAFEGNDVKPGDLLRENIITITGLLKLMLGTMTASEEALIDKALLDTYAIKGITMSREDPTGIPPPTMGDFHSVLSSMKGAEEISQRLQKYTTGTYAGIFNQETNVNLNSGLVVFCIRDLEDQLRPIAMYIILNYIWNKVRSELKKRILVVDEAWTMMQHEDAAKFLYGLVKRARKYYLGITTITQDVEDFLRSPYGKPVVTNSSMAILMKQAPSSMEVLQKTFNLTDGEKYLLLNSGVGQGLFFADNKHVAIQIIASYNENKIVTTNPEEVLAQRVEDAKGL
ncbi:MAG: DUF87 domain-containing protein [Candidatus Gracilibacteria bacterium]|nr:DUF87 domain-containing protein [Candidatus Gracilibacteria bacterium]MDD5178974.1 DUF87 domain-containing protein [Candidatus Gracilibacteria bacterium]